MTAEALSPPDPMQSLRERLIQDGTIVPSDKNVVHLKRAAHEVIEFLKEKIAKTFAFFQELGQKFSAYAEAIKRYKDDFYDAYSVAHLGCSYFSVLKFLNIFRSLNVLINKEQRSFNKSGIARTGFFFAFKENMKNTP